MDVRLTNLGETPLVEMRGDIDHGTRGALETTFDNVLGRGNAVVLLDLSDVTYIDSGGLSVLFSEARKLREGGWIGLIAPNPNVQRLLEIVGLFADPRFRVFPDRKAAEATVVTKTTS
jgi:anti-anti-sigma factor